MIKYLHTHKELEEKSQTLLYTNFSWPVTNTGSYNLHKHLQNVCIFLR